MLSTMPNAGEWNAEAKTMLYTNHKLRRCAARDVTIGSWIQALMTLNAPAAAMFFHGNGTHVHDGEGTLASEIAKRVRVLMDPDWQAKPREARNPRESNLGQAVQQVRVHVIGG